MRRALVIAVAIPALALSACSSAEEESPSDDTEASTATQAPVDDAAMTSDTAMTTATSEPGGDQAGATGDSAAATGDSAADTGGSDVDVEGGSDGQAAADVTKKFITALSQSDPSMCDYMANLQGDGTGPLKDDQELLDICKETIPAQTEGAITQEQAAILGAMEISGADVQGDTATVDKDNFSDLFAAGFAEQTFVLKKFDGEWFIDTGLSTLTAPPEPEEG